MTFNNKQIKELSEKIEKLEGLKSSIEDIKNQIGEKEGGRRWLGMAMWGWLDEPFVYEKTPTILERLTALENYLGIEWKEEKTEFSGYKPKTKEVKSQDKRKRGRPRKNKSNE